LSKTTDLSGRYYTCDSVR